MGHDLRLSRGEPNLIQYIESELDLALRLLILDCTRSSDQYQPFRAASSVRRRINGSAIAHALEPFFALRQNEESLCSLVECCYIATILHVVSDVASCDLGLGPSQQQVTA